MIPTSTDVTIQVKDKVPANAEAIVVFVAEDGGESSTWPTLSRDESAAIKRMFASSVARGKTKEVIFDVVALPAGAFRRVVIAGLGKAEKISTESIRQSAGAALRAVRKHRLSRIAIVPPAPETVGIEAGVEAVITGMLLTAFDYREYKGTAGKKDADDAKAFSPQITIVAEPGKVRAAVERARIIADGQNFARTIASRPGNDINPPSLAKIAQSFAREVGLGVRVLDEKQMAKLGMGGILGVGAGSIATPPRMIVLEHLPKKASRRAPLLVVGKAITFDTGGISIKPAEKMGKMIYDKCGGMTVLGLMYAIAKLKLPVPVVGILSSAENHISSQAYRPGDILRMYNGVTVEVTNTDAEGRLVLGDALAWGIETYKPRAVIDLATLTGGVIVALGKTMAGVMSNSDTLVDEITRSATAAGEKLWRLPLGDEQRDQIKSEHADIVNSAGREGHPLQGGAFLSHFIPSDGSIPWAHLDIAGVADTEKDLPYYGKGATGWGVRTLLEWVESNDENRLKHATPRAAGG
jgi:leucyl aminopeptidase